MAMSGEKWSLYWLARNKPWWLVILSGLLMAAAFPPSPLAPLGFFGFVPLFILAETLPERLPEDTLFLPFKKFWVIFFRMLTLQFLWRRNISVFRYQRRIISANAQMFRYTYFAFFLWNLICCYWLSLTVLNAWDFTDGLERMSAGVLAVTLNPILMSSPWQFYARMRRVIAPLTAAAWLMVFWIAFEHLHFRWDLSWSWLTLGHSLTGIPSLLQYTEFTGVLGASFYVLMANLLIYAIVRNVQQPRVANWKLASLASAWILLPLGLNIFILNPGREIFKASGEMNVRIIQPNIPPEEKFNEYSIKGQMQYFADMIVSRPIGGIDLVIMPETALPVAMDANELKRFRIMRPLWDITDSAEVSILTGVVEERLFFPGEEIPPSASLYNVREDVYRDTYNAATLLSRNGAVRFYEKSKMVPMVERMPFLETFHFLKNVGIDMGTGIGGYGIPDSLILLETHEGVPFGTMICYESQFGDFVRRQTLKGARLLTIITNDGWWDKSSGYIQHAGLSVLRAIENRRDIARSANTGRSQFVDCKGNISQPTGYWVPAVIDGKVNLYDGLTFYVKYGDWPGWICLMLTALVCAWAIVRKFRK